MSVNNQMAYKAVPSQVLEMEGRLRGQEASPLRAAQIQVECSRIGEGTEVLLKLLSDLKMRLTPVLRPETDEPARENGIENSPERLAPHADFLRSRNHLIQTAINDITSILNRIEL